MTFYLDRRDLSAFLATAAALVAIAVWRRLTLRKLPLPPGPPQKFIVGNAHQMPERHSWRVFREWSKKYGKSIRFILLYLCSSL
jgi:hypothetical protein